jgi:signal transduction histidine kinase
MDAANSGCDDDPRILIPTTLTLYLVAGIVSLSLASLMAAIAHRQPGSWVLRNVSLGIFILAGGLTAAGFGAVLPRWTMVICANMTMISAGVVMYSGFAAYCAQQKPKLDRFGWGVVALTALPFWYWGLIEPNGNYRSVVFSLAAAVIIVRIPILLVRSAPTGSPRWPVLILAVLYSVFSIWMALRGVYLLMEEQPAAPLRGANPTSWITVFWYIVMISLLTACIIWLELRRASANQSPRFFQIGQRQHRAVFDFFEFFQNQLQLLWATVLILVLGIGGLMGLYSANSYELEQARLTQAATLSNDAYVSHSKQVVSQIDTLLNSVRSYYLRTGSPVETERFINALPFDRTTIDNVYIANAQANLVVSHDPTALGLSLAERDYFLFQKATPGDQIFISQVEVGLVTGKYHFRVARRISNPDGSFAGVVLCTVNPEAFAHHYRQLGAGLQNSATLLGVVDRKLRARTPQPQIDRWQTPVESPLWDALAQSESGVYTNKSSVDDIARVYVYKKIDDLPLVMVTGFSASDLATSVHNRARWPLLGALIALGMVVGLAWLLTVEIRQRNEQDNFMSMLSHELKTPLSVLRIALEQDTLSDSTRAYAQQSVHDLDTLIYRCLQADRLESRHQGIERQPCSLRELLADLQTACAAPQNLHLSVADLPIFSCDIPLLSIALNNLIDNALKYAATGSLVQINASSQTYRHRSGILISVANTPGTVGLPDANQVFKKYYRSPRAHSKTGSGLGLYLVHNVARQLGGWVHYVPSAGQVCFELWLPT